MSGENQLERLAETAGWRKVMLELAEAAPLEHAADFYRRAAVARVRLVDRLERRPA